MGRNNSKVTIQKFVERASIIHDNYYDYSLIKIEPKNSKEKVDVICPKHGKFSIEINAHLLGIKCRDCGYEQRNNRELTHEEFIRRSKLKHGDLYDYSLTNYQGHDSVQSIICPIHNIFKQRACMHIHSNGCPKCGDVRTGKGVSRKEKDWIAICNKKHNFKYDYSKVDYIDYHTKVEIICPVHGNFWETPKKHKISPVGCKECGKDCMGYNKSRFKARCDNKDGNGILYIIKCYNDEEVFLKIGITSNSVKQRFHYKKDIIYDFNIIKEIAGKGDKIWEMERALHKRFKEFKYQPKIGFAGQTECFTTEVLNFIHDI